MSQNSPKVIYFGSDSFVVQVLEGLEEKFNVVGVVTTPNSPVANYAKNNFSVYTPEKLDDEIFNELKKLEPDLIVVASYGKIIPNSILDLPKFGALNIHPSLLPKYRGPSPVPSTILNGDQETGVTIMKMDEELDHGPVISTKTIKLTGQEDLQELINKLFQVGTERLLDTIPDFIAGNLKPVEQNHDIATYTNHLSKEDGYFDINEPPSNEKLDRMIRAFYPWPGVWTRWNGKIVKFYPKGMVQMEGKKALPFKDFLNGYQNFPLKFNS